MRTRLALAISMLVPALVAAQTGGKAPAQQPTHPQQPTHAARAATPADTTHKAHPASSAHRRRTHTRKSGSASATNHGAAVKATAKPDSAKKSMPAAAPKTTKP